MRPRESWASDFPKACSRVAGQPSPESDNRPAASFAGPRSVNLKQGCLGGQIVKSPMVFHSESREIRIHGKGSVERRDRIRPREHPREVVWGYREQGPLLHHAPRVLHDRFAASVRVPEGQRAGRLEGDGEGLRVREGAVRDPDGQGLRRGPARGEQGLGGPGLRGIGGYQSDLAGEELLPRSGRDQPETVRAVPASPHEDREGRDRTGGPVEERTARLDQPPERRARPHDANVPGRTEGPAGATGHPARRDFGGGDRLGAPAHQDAHDGVRLVAVPRPLPGRAHAAHSGEGRRQGASLRHHGRGKTHTRSDGRVEGEPRSREGRPSFEKLQLRERPGGKIHLDYLVKTLPATYVAFDVLYIGTENVMGQTQMERKALLREVLEEDDRIVLSDYIEARGVDYYNAVIARGLEGIIAKRKDARYAPGKRSKDWIKIKKKTTLDCVIAGITAGEGEREDTFGSLIMAAYLEGSLFHVGRAGTGFPGSFRRSLYPKLVALRQDECPFAEMPEIDAHVGFWTRPALVAEVHFLEFSKERHMRAPSFSPMREDKRPEDCIVTF